jgi:hypothetical protein
MGIAQNRLVPAVLVLTLLGTWSLGGPVDPTRAVAPSTQPTKLVDPVEDLRQLTDSVFRTQNDAEVPPVAIDTATAPDPRETIVIPFPTTFWTGLTTLAGMAGVYMKRRIYR